MSCRQGRRVGIDRDATLVHDPCVPEAAGQRLHGAQHRQQREIVGRMPGRPADQRVNSKPEVVVDDQRRVVREALREVNELGLGLGGDARRGQVVVTRTKNLHKFRARAHKG
jgi:hypothetical protein